MAGYPNAQSNPAAAIPVWVAPPPGASSTNIATNTGTQVKTGAGVFTGLSINTAGTASTATVYDGTSSAGVKLGTFATTAQGAITMPAGGLPFSTGLFIQTAGSAAADLTATYI